MVSVRPADQIGRVVGGRYRLVAPLGSGTSAQVYLADDVTLRRQVAVKMLQPALATDHQFLAWFRNEAEAIASVNHPNIVVVHDFGVDEVPFLVTEYLAGGSLRGMLQTGHRLSTSQALLVGLEATKGLAHAHGRGLVHRDLKPANLLFGEDGRLRIADFGLSRALAERGTTEHDGTVVGTMRYAAPEQARGEGSGPASDVYALALVLVEAVTGRVPFAGNDPVSALQARTREDLVVPEALGPIRGAVARAGRLDPAERSDAEELGIALLAASERLDPPVALPLVGALSEATTADEDPDERTEVAPGVVVPDDADTEPAEGPSSGRRRRWPLVALAAAVVAALVAVALFVAPGLLDDDAEVPELVGRSIDEVQLVADQNGWVIDEKKTRQDGTEPGEIVATDPEAGTALGEGEVLVVLVSEGNELTDRPDQLVGRPVAEVELALERAGLEWTSTEVFHETVEAGHVIGTDGPVESELPKGTSVPLLVSKGPAPRTIPTLPDGTEDGPTFETVAEMLSDLSLVPVREDVFHDEVPAGIVLGLDPRPGNEVPRDSEVVVRVSKGPDLVTVPSLGGMTLDEAEATLIQAGLTLGQDCCASRGRVVGSDPPAGAEVRRGTAVNVFLAR